MAQYDELISVLKSLLTERFAPKPRYVRGVLGDGLGNVTVPGRPDKSYVRFQRSGATYFEIFNRSVNPVNDWPVLIGELPWQPGLTQVVDTDWSAFEQSGWGDNLGATSPHAPTHEWPDGSPGSDPVNIYLRSIAPGRAYVDAGSPTTIFVNSFEYGTTGTLWPGTPGLNLQPIMSATTTGTMRYAGVYVDAGTNTLAAVTGSTTVHTSALEPPRVTFPAGVVTIARVRLYGGQSSLAETDIRDARRLFGTSETPNDRIPVTNTSGATVAAGDVGYIDAAGEYKRTTTAADSVAWCVVVSGGANNAGVYVARHGRVLVNYTGTAPNAGEYLITSTTGGSAQAQATMRPEIFAVCVGAGSGGQVEALLLTGTTPVPKTLSIDIFRVVNTGLSDFTSTIATLPGGAVLTFGVVGTGYAANLVAYSPAPVAKIVLHNTTRGTDALVLDCVVGTSTITLTANVPAGWQVGDTITIRSQTNTNTIGSSYFVDFELSGSSINPLARSLDTQIFIVDFNAGGHILRLHPYEAGSISKRFGQNNQVANITNYGFPVVPLISNRFCMIWSASGAATLFFAVQLQAELVAAP